jgi:hypothetical protein
VRRASSDQLASGRDFGASDSATDLTLVGDYDERRRRVRLGARTAKTRKAHWVELHPLLAKALEARLGQDSILYERGARGPHSQLGSGVDAVGSIRPSDGSRASHGELSPR